MTANESGRSGDARLEDHRWTILALTRLVVRYWRPIAVGCAVSMIFTAVVMLFSPNYYVSTASILPSGKVDNMSALKEVVGLSSSANMDENSSALFPIILKSRIVADSILARTYTIESDEKQLQIVPSVYFGSNDPDELRQGLDAATSITVEKKTGDIHIAVETRYPQLSQAFVQTYLNALEDFNLNRRKSVAHQNAQYLVAQSARALDSLKLAEDALADFRSHNADWAGSTNAAVLGDLTRLQREVEVKTSTYIYLQQQLEMARIDEQKDVPIVRVLDTPSLPTLKSRPRRLLSVLLAGLAAFLLTTLAVLIREHLKRESTGAVSTELADLKNKVQSHMPVASRMLRLVNKSTQIETTATRKEL